MAGRGTDIKLGGNKDFVHNDNKDIKTAELKKMRKRLKKLGGLFIIGTERHESRRIDNQLRGDQEDKGDPGSINIFYKFTRRLNENFWR